MKKTFSIIVLLSILATCFNYNFIVQADEKATTTISYQYGNSNVSYSREMETLDRGLIAVKTNDGVFLSWRLLGDESTVNTVKSSPKFNVYKNGSLLTTVKSSTNYIDKSGTADDSYYVSADSGVHMNEASDTVSALNSNYVDIPMEAPDAFSYTDDAGETVVINYSIGDTSVGDLDGDGQYELVVKWNPNPKDNSHSGVTGNVYLDAYELDGTNLWRIDLGRNIRSGEHYTQFLVYDFDLDGHAEVTCKTAPGSLDGNGNYVTESSSIDAIKNADNLAVYINSGGYVLDGPEYFTIFDGMDGSALDTIYYPVQRVAADSGIWGDSYGNRLDRYVADVAYLDGVRPYAVYVRGYYDHRNSVCAITFDGENLNCEDCFDTYDVDSYGSKSSSPSYDSSTGEYLGVKGYIAGKNYNMYMGQGNHNMTIADVDGDGRDEVITGGACYEKTAPGDTKGKLVNGGTAYEIVSAGAEVFEPKWCTGRGHGDALHIGDYDPTHDGFEFFTVHESSPYGMSVIDAATGELLYHEDASKDTGRGIMANVGAGGYYQFLAVSGLGSMRKALGNGEFETSNIGGSVNSRIFWNGDLYEELLDKTTITTYNASNTRMETLFTADGCVSINGSKAPPALSADIFGDWREEVAYPLSDNSALRIFTTTIETKYKLPTLMHDPVYRSGVSAEQSAYNQPPHIGFYLSEDLFANEIIDLEITELPSKTVYSVGDTFDRTGMVVTAFYDDDEYPSEIVTNYSISGFDAMSAQDNQTITISYRGMSKTFTIEILTDFTVDENGYITGYKGTSHSSIIPKTIDSIAVKGIADNALTDTTLTEVYVYDHIKEIGENAFGNSLTVNCYEGSAAHIYAAENGIPHETIERINKDYYLNITFNENEYLNFTDMKMSTTGITTTVGNLTYTVPGRNRGGDYFSGFSIKNENDNTVLKACVSRFAAQRESYAPHITLSDVPLLSQDYDYVFETDIYFNDDTTVADSPAKSKMDVYDSSGIIDSVHCEALGLETNVWYNYQLIQHENKYIRVVSEKDGGVISISTISRTPSESGVNRLIFGGASGSFVTKINGKNTALGNSYILLDNMSSYSAELAVSNAVISVRNSKTQAPISGAILRSGTLEFVSGNDGRINISNIPCGTYNFEITADGYTKDSITLVAYEKNISRDMFLSAPLIGLAFENSSISLIKGSSVVLSPIMTPVNSTDTEFVWASDNESVATVKDGTINAISSGSATITITSSVKPEIKAECVVKVFDGGYDKIPTSIEIECNEKSGTIPTFGKNTTVQFTATVYDQNGVEMDENVTFSTDNSLISISSDGYLTIPSNISASEVIISAKCNNVTKTLSLPLVKMIEETTIFANPDFHIHSGLHMRMSAEAQTFIIDDDITLGVGARSSPDNTTGFSYTDGYLTGYVGEYANAGNRHAYMSFTNSSLPATYANNTDYILQFDFNFKKPTVDSYTHTLTFADDSNNPILSIAEENYSMLKVDTWYTAQIIYSNQNYVVTIFNKSGNLVAITNMTSTNNTAIKRINFFGTGGRAQSNPTAIDNLKYYSSPSSLSAVDIFVYDESNLPMTSTVSIGNAVIGDTDSSGKISYMLPYGGYTISATQSGSVIGTTEILVDGKTTSFAITSSNVIPTPSPSPTPTPSPEYDVIKIDNATNTLSVKVDNRTPKALYIASYDEDNSLKSVQVKYAINGFNINLSDIDYDKIFLWEADTQKPLDVFIK